MKNKNLITAIIWSLIIIIITAIGTYLLMRDKNLSSFNNVNVYEASVNFNDLPSPAPDKSSEKSVIANGEKININTATKEELITLEGIGEIFAQRIIDYRKEHPFKTIYDIKKVSGIGEKTFEKIEHFITVGE